MATTTASVVCDNSTLAHFQSWVQAIFTALTTLGWTQTTDTGQAANPPAAVPSSTYVYYVFKSADALSTSAPIFLKLEVGFSSTLPSIRITAGSGSDGVGNVTGPTMGPYIITGNGATNGQSNQGSTAFNCYFSGDSGSFRMMMWQGGSAAEVVFVIERSRDTSGNATADHVSIAAMNAVGNTGAGNLQQSFIPSQTSAAEKSSAILGIQPNSSGGGNYAGKTPAGPVIPLIGFPGNQMLALVMASAADVVESNGTVVTVNIYGSNHSFLFTLAGNIPTFCGRLNGANQNGALGMLYE